MSWDPIFCVVNHNYSHYNWASAADTRNARNVLGCWSAPVFPTKVVGVSCNGSILLRDSWQHVCAGFVTLPNQRFFFLENPRIYAHPETVRKLPENSRKHTKTTRKLPKIPRKVQKKLWGRRCRVLCRFFFTVVALSSEQFTLWRTINHQM